MGPLPGPAALAAALGPTLAPACAPGDVVYGPSDPSLFVAALTPCHAAFGHRVLTPGFEERAAEPVAFFSESATARWRASASRPWARDSSWSRPGGSAGTGSLLTGRASMA